MLNGNSQGVVHNTPTRTRLRVPADYRERDEMRKLETHIQDVPGIRYCETNEHTGSITIFHDPDPEILEHIGQAIEGLDQKLYSLLVEERPRENKGSPVFSNLFSKQSDGITTASGHLEKGLPIAILATGVVTLVEAESIVVGIAPIVLFYYAFNLYWKFTQGRESATMAPEANFS